jgi:outer membrane lipoprotein SlyB
MDGLLRISALALPVLLSACVSIPSGPSITSLPGTGKSFDQFRADDLECRQYAGNTVGGTSPAEAQADSAVKSGAVGAVVGGLAGAAIGGHEGAGAGAGVGLLVGAMAGSQAANTSGYNVQQRYDSAYVQCMYARGNRVPMATAPRSVSSRPRSSPPSASGPYYPPPPPGYESAQAPPPPPPRGSAPPGAPSAGSDRLFVYPRSGQSEARTANDHSECGRWASNQSGYDASRPNPADPRRSDYQRAISACLEGRGYTVR